MLMRGGTSKGVFFLAEDLPTEREERDSLLLRILGSPDARQIDGIGGAHPLTSKIAVVSPSELPDADVDYLFLQVQPEGDNVVDTQLCGNLLAGVGPFAIERGLAQADKATSRITVHMVNTGSYAELAFPTPDGLVDYAGTTTIAGVPGTAAEVTVGFRHTTGAVCGSLLPTGNVLDRISGIDLTMIDNGMPVAVSEAQAFDITGYESPAELEANARLCRELEDLRIQVGEAMGLGDVRGSTIPKMALVAPPRTGGAICTRMFIPHRCHEAIGVLAGVTVATACRIPGTTTDASQQLAHEADPLRLEHPTGHLDARVRIEVCNNEFVTTKAAVVNTARKLFDGTVWPGPRRITTKGDSRHGRDQQHV